MRKCRPAFETVTQGGGERRVGHHRLVEAGGVGRAQDVQRVPGVAGARAVPGTHALTSSRASLGVGRVEYRRAEGSLRAGEQRLGGADRPAEDLGAVADGEIVDVAQGQDRTVNRRQLSEDVVGDHAVDLGIPWIVRGLREFLHGLRCPLGASPVVGEFVSRDPDQPGCRRFGVPVLPDGVHRGQEGLRRDVLGDPAGRRIGG